VAALAVVEGTAVLGGAQNKEIRATLNVQYGSEQ
jgi:hypothetical protein